MIEQEDAPVEHCPSCGARLSEPGSNCPSCGAPIVAETSPRPRDNRPLIAVGIGLALAGVVAVIALSSASNSGSGSSSTKLPAPGELSAGTIAVVTNVPGKRGTVTKADLNHSIEVSAAGAGLPSVPKPGDPKYKKTEESALNSLLDQATVQGQAAEMGIAFSQKQVIAQLDQVEKKNFKNQAQYAAFLKKSRFTQSDVLERIESQMLSTAIQRKVVEGISGKAAMQKAFAKFVTAYAKRWRSRTVCAPPYAVERCSNGPAPTSSSGPTSAPGP